MEPTREKRYKRRIAELEAQLAQRDERITMLEKQFAELIRQNKKLTEQIAKLSKNSSKSSKSPSPDIIKPSKDQKSKKRRRQGGQPVHLGVNHAGQPFSDGPTVECTHLDGSGRLP